MAPILQKSLSVPSSPSVEEERTKSERDGVCLEVELEVLRRRVICMNGRFFEHFASCHVCPVERQRQVIADLNLETQHVPKTKTSWADCFRDDLALRNGRWLTRSLSHGSEREITEYAHSLQWRISRHRPLKETMAFQPFVVSRQQKLLFNNEQDIGELLNRQASLSSQVSELSARVEDRSKESAIVRRRIETLAEKKCKLEMEIQSLLQDIPALNSSKVDLEAEGRKLSEKVQRLRSQQRETNDWIRTREEQIAIQRREILEHDETYRCLKKEQRDADGQLETLQEKLNGHLSELQELQKQKETFTGELETKKDMLKTVVAQGKEQKKEIRALEKQQHDLEHTLAALQKERATMDHIRRRRHDAIQQLRYKTEIQQHENKAMSRAGLCPDKTTMQTLSHRAKRKDEIRRDRIDARCRKTCSTGTMTVEMQNSADTSLTRSRDVEFASASRSGDLLIRCLEKELKRQQEVSREQTRTIEALSEDLNAGRQRDSNPAFRPVEPPHVLIQILFCVTGKDRGRKEK